MRETPVETLVPDYVRFYEEWTGRKLTSEIAAKDLANHAVFNLEEQLALLMTHKAKANFKTGLQTLPHSMKASAWYARKTGSACGA